jgi:chloride channel protein, CIC family
LTYWAIEVSTGTVSRKSLRAEGATLALQAAEKPAHAAANLGASEHGADSRLHPRTRAGVSPLVVAATVCVGAAAAWFANGFRSAMLWVTNQISGQRDAVEAVRSLGPWRTMAITFVGLLVAAWLGSVAQRWRNDGLGIAAVADSVQGVDRGPSVPGTMVRSGATWVAAATTASLGRESAIIEAGAALGAATGRRVGRRGAQFAATGITAAFAAAYHAPIAAVLYVEEHLSIRRCRRTVVHALVGSAIGFWMTRLVFDTHALLPGSSEPWSWKLWLVALVVVVPAYLSSRGFVWLRDSLVRGYAHATDRRRRMTWSIVAAAASAALVGLVPLTAGNGLEALRESAGGTTVAVALALVFGKAVAEWFPRRLRSLPERRCCRCTVSLRSALRQVCRLGTLRWS